MYSLLVNSKLTEKLMWKMCTIYPQVIYRKMLSKNFMKNPQRGEKKLKLFLPNEYENVYHVQPEDLKTWD